MSKLLLALFSVSCILFSSPSIAAKLTIEVANNGQEISRSELKEYKKTFREAARSNKVPDGWRQLNGNAIRRALKGKTIRTTFLSGNNCVLYFAFFNDGDVKRLYRKCSRSTDSGKYRIFNNKIKVLNIVYDVYSNGSMFVFARQYSGKWRGQIFKAGRKITFSEEDAFKRN